MEYFIGVISSLTAALLIYVFRYQFGFILNFLFAKVYPNVAGEYRIFQYDFSPAKNDGETKEEELVVDGEIDLNKDYRLSINASDRELLNWLKDIEAVNDTVFKMELKQFTNKIKGEVFQISKGRRKTIENVQGRITPSRIILLNSETKDENHHNFGTYLLTIKNDTRILKGTNSSLCISCGDATSDYIILEKD